MSNELNVRSLSGNRLDHPTNTVVQDPGVFVGSSTTGGWYRVNVSNKILPWVQEHGDGMWAWDRSMIRSSNNNYLIVRPKLLTLLKLKWS